MENTIGPRYFAFFVGGCLTIILLAIVKLDVQKDALNTEMQLLPKMRAARPRTVVLAYTSFFSQIQWINHRDKCDPDQRDKKQCSLDHFEVIYDKTRFSESNIVVFHARNMPSLQHLKSLLKSRPASQRWMYALWESPNATPDTTPLNGLFNLTWTYRIDSDIWGPYGRYEQLCQEDIKMNKMAESITDYTQGKSELVAWMVSNCDPQLRLSLVRELKKYIKVDVFGSCSSVFGESRYCPRSETSGCLKKYKFYLSFENALCEDYITEKYWSRLGKKL